MLYSYVNFKKFPAGRILRSVKYKQNYCRSHALFLSFHHHEQNGSGTTEDGKGVMRGPKIMLRHVTALGIFFSFLFTAKPCAAWIPGSLPSPWTEKSFHELKWKVVLMGKVSSGQCKHFPLEFCMQGTPQYSFQ